MRALAALVFLAAGCNLYFGQSGPSGGGGGDYPIVDAGRPPGDGLYPPPYGDAGPLPDGGPTGSAVNMVRCEDGQLFAVTAQPGPDQPGHGVGKPFGVCPGACRSAATLCTKRDCSDAPSALCGAQPSVGATCSLSGMPCSGGDAISCPESTTCGYSVAGSSCTCSDGKYQCSQLTGAAATQGSIVGKWRGTVIPPSFAQPYQVTLWIYPDGTYWAQCDSGGCDTPFYYGGSGPFPSRRITILSTDPTLGSWADIGIYFGSNPPNTGAIVSLVADASTLRFTFYASWFSCGQPFEFDLKRY